VGRVRRRIGLKTAVQFWAMVAWTVLWCVNPGPAWAVSGTIQLETGDAVNGDISVPPKNAIEIVLAESRKRAVIPIEDIKKIEVPVSQPDAQQEPSALKRFSRRFMGASEAEQALTITLRTGEMYHGWLAWRQSEGALEVRPSKYVVEKVYLKSKQADRERHHPADLTRRYVRSITFSDVAPSVQKKCPKCDRSFEQPDYKFCPLDGTPLTEQAVSSHN